MAFIDEIEINLKSGDGGNGVEKWLHEKNKEFMGPCGGNGGRGGDVFVRGVRDMNVLFDYLREKKFQAADGESGGNHSKEGKSGESLVLKVPVGSIVTNLKTNEKFYIEKEGQKELVLKGGNGGYGNEYFKSSRNTTPRETTPGKPGEEADFSIELELIADVGLVGFPNAGKSSLLNSLTSANSKVGDYPFTTLSPHLGALYGYVLADIPGIIEGASEGKGLGRKFLKHIKRTKMILHLISVENEDVVKVYQQIRKELDTYDQIFSKKREVVVLSKIDLISPEEVKTKKMLLEKLGLEVVTLSILDDRSVKETSEFLTKILQN